MDLLQQDLQQIKLQFQQPLQSSQATVEPSPTSTQVRRCFIVVIPITLDPTAHREVNYRGDNVEEVKVQDRSVIYPLLALTTQIFKRVSSVIEGQMTGRTDVDEPQQIKSNDCLRTTTAAPDMSTRGKRDTGIGTGLLGEPNEAMVSVGGKMFPALLDTGSTVSTISQDGFDFLDEQVLYPIEDVLRIECADGQLLPYLGYIEVAVDVPGCEGETENVILLVVPNTPYNTNVPVLLSTIYTNTLPEREC